MAAPRRVIWTPRARGHIDAVFEYVARDSVAAAERLTSALIERVNRLDQFPERGRRVPELGRSDIREVFAHQYRLIYRVTTTEVIVIGIVHGARHLLSALASD